jgi:hypothetical protein
MLATRMTISTFTLGRVAEAGPYLEAYAIKKHDGRQPIKRGIFIIMGLVTHAKVGNNTIKYHVKLRQFLFTSRSAEVTAFPL